MALKCTVQPTTEPLTREETKVFLRVDVTEDNDLIESLIKAAREYAEKYSKRQLMSATYQLTLDAFPPWEIEIPRPPLQSISSVTYVDANGTTQTVSSADYLVDTASEPARVSPAYEDSWPSARCQYNAVTITFVAGYTTAALVPSALKHGMRLLIGHWYENREAVVTGTIATQVPSGFADLFRAFWPGKLH